MLHLAGFFPSKVSRGSRSGDSIFNAPSFFNPVSNGGSIYAKKPSPFGLHKCFTIKSNKLTGSFISSLFYDCRPLAVLRGIRSIIIDSIKLMFGRGSFTHVGEEVLKRANPAITHRDSSGSVMEKTFSLGVGTPGLHRSPNVKFRAVRHSMRESVGVTNTSRFFHVSSSSYYENKNLVNKNLKI